MKTSVDMSSASSIVRLGRSSKRWYIVLYATIPMVRIKTSVAVPSRITNAACRMFIDLYSRDIR